MARAYVIPAGYNDAIDAAAARNGLAPDFFRGTIAKESAFDPYAVSSTGALGLGQVLPSTAARPGYGVAPLANPYDPQANIDFSAAYLKARGTTGYSGGEYSSVVPIGRDGLPSGAASSLGTGSSPSTGIDGLPATDPFGGAGGNGQPTSASNPSTFDALKQIWTGNGPSETSGTIPNLLSDPMAKGAGYGGNNPVSTATGGLHDWFRRIIIALLGLVMLTVAIAALARAGTVGAIRKGVGV